MTLKLAPLSGLLLILAINGTPAHGAENPTIQKLLEVKLPADGGVSGTVVCLDVHTKKTLATASTPKSEEPALNGSHPVGLAILPVLLTTALDSNQFTETTVVRDDMRMGGADPAYRGAKGKPVTLREMAQRGRGQAMIQVANAVGLEKLIDATVAAGFQRNRVDTSMGLAIGGHTEATPLQLATVYAGYATSEKTARIRELLRRPEMNAWGTKGGGEHGSYFAGGNARAVCAVYLQGGDVRQTRLQATELGERLLCQTPGSCPLLF